MSKLKLSGKQLRVLGYPEGPVISVAMHEMCTNFRHYSEEEALHILKKILTETRNLIKRFYLFQLWKFTYQIDFLLKKCQNVENNWWRNCRWF